jgi:hypothetical protein
MACLVVEFQRDQNSTQYALTKAHSFHMACGNMALVTDAETVVDGEAVATATATRRRST